MSVRANWHLDSLDSVEYEDPMQAGLRVDVTDAGALRAELAVLLSQEASYAQTVGLECSLKWTAADADGNPDARNPCYTCPHFTVSDEDPLSLLCSLGREQNDLLDALRELKGRPSLDEELCRVYSDRIESYAEMGEALVAA